MLLILTRQYLVLILSTLFLLSCTPDEMTISVYTSDIDAAKNGETVQVPVKMTFSMPGQDKNNDLEKVEVIVKEYLAPKSKFTIVKGKYSNSVVVETTIDFGINDNPNKRILKLNYYPPRKEFPKEAPMVQLNKKKDVIKELNSRLREINFMLTLSLPPKNSKLRIISDSKVPYKIQGLSTWVSKKPYLNYVTTLNKREETEMLFKGGSNSVYSQIPVHFNLRKMN